jgi:tRNA(Ile)-lysidine synthase
MNIIQKTKESIKRYSLLNTGDRVLVGVSGGPDSIALLHILNKLRYELGINLYVSHINHQLRKSADADQKFVQDLCKSLNIPCYVLKLNMKNIRNKGSLEEIARKKRFDGFIRTAGANKANVIALAHHQDDLAETVLMRILRGTGLLGLQGILPKRKFSGLQVIRPFLDIPKRDIDVFLKKSNIKYRIDPTNKQACFFRNKIRLELLPKLKKNYNNNISEVLAHLADNTAVDYDYLHNQGQKSLKKLSMPTQRKNQIKLSLSPLKKLHPSLLRMVIRLSIEQLKGDMRRLTLNHINEVEDLIHNRPEGAVVNLAGNIYLTKQKSALSLALRKT